MLMNNTIAKDLQTENSFIIMTTLTLLRYFLTEQLISQIMPTLKKLTKHQTSIIRRKTFLVLYNNYEKYNAQLPDIKAYALEAMNDVETPVMFAGLCMIKPLIMSNPHKHKQLAKKLVHILSLILDHKYPK